MKTSITKDFKNILALHKKGGISLSKETRDYLKSRVHGDAVAIEIATKRNLKMFDEKGKFEIKCK